MCVLRLPHVSTLKVLRVRAGRQPKPKDVLSSLRPTAHSSLRLANLAPKRLRTVAAFRHVDFGAVGDGCAVQAHTRMGL